VKSPIVVMVVCLLPFIGCDPEIENLGPGPNGKAGTSNYSGSAGKGGGVEERTPFPVALPWTAKQVKDSVKIGRRWILREHQILQVGAKKEERFATIQAEIIEVGQDSYKIRESVLDPKTRKVIGEARVKTGSYDQSKGIYTQLNIKETKISEEVLSLGGRTWKTKVYHNRRIVDFQEQILTIWNSVEVPGLALKMVFKSPRRKAELVLLEYHEGGS
jgi:hypothetical protein